MSLSLQMLLPELAFGLLCFNSSFMSGEWPSFGENPLEKLSVLGSQNSGGYQVRLPAGGAKTDP